MEPPVNRWLGFEGSTCTCIQIITLYLSVSEKECHNFVPTSIYRDSERLVQHLTISSSTPEGANVLSDVFWLVLVYTSITNWVQFGTKVVF